MVKLPLLTPIYTPRALVASTKPGTWHLEIPAGPARHYRLAQLDDYRKHPRNKFPWQPALRLSLRGRVSAENLPGTWGFGFWNDPFSLSMGLGGTARRFPALPNAAWYFFASPPNYLSFRDDLPAQGFLAATFRAAQVPAWLLGLSSPGLGISVLPGGAQLVRKVLRRFVHQSVLLISGDVTSWHTYVLDWQLERVTFIMDGVVIHETPVSPHGPLGLVLWIDNQYAALPAEGRLSYGTLVNPHPAWLEIEDITLE